MRFLLPNRSTKKNHSSGLSNKTMDKMNPLISYENIVNDTRSKTGNATGLQEDANAYIDTNIGNITAREVRILNDTLDMMHRNLNAFSRWTLLRGNSSNVTAPTVPAGGELSENDVLNVNYGLACILCLCLCYFLIYICVCLLQTFVWDCD